MIAILIVIGASVALGLFFAVFGVLTGADQGQFRWPPKWPARYPAPPQHRAPKGLGDIYGDALAWLREDPREPARHGGRQT